MEEIKRPLLTIAIPTYNRPKQLRNTLEKLLPQITNECFVLIIDNCSDVPVEETVKDIFQKYPEVNYIVKRNRVNIGGDSNIMRCFEYCATEWLWTLGDDDEITENAIEIIFNDIENNPESLFFNYYTPNKLHPKRTVEKRYKGKLDFLKNIDLLAAIIFISSNLYNIKKFKRDKSCLAYRYTYSCAAQVVILLFNMNDSDEIVLSNKVICSSLTTFSEKYSNFNIWIVRGLSTLIDMPFDQSCKNAILFQLNKLTNSWIKIEAILKSLLIDYYNNAKITNIKKEYKRLYSIFYKNLSIGTRLRAFFWLCILSISIRLTFRMIRFGYMHKRKFDIKQWLN